MGTSGKFRRSRVRRNRQGFTLVELLTVIVIIGILASLITGAAIMARGAVKRTVVLTEIAQLEIALQRYKNEFGEYPPDFTGLNENDDLNPINDTPGEAAAKVVLNRHLRKRFPRFRGDWDAAAVEIFTNYGVDATRLDSASALAFWLGGLPEDPTLGTRPAGFHKDPAHPFKTGLPRSQTLFEFSDDEDRYTYATPATPANVLRCYYFPTGVTERPYVYFRPQRFGGERTYAFVERDPSDTTVSVYAVRTWPAITPSAPPSDADGNSDRAVPYVLGGNTWPADETYQIISSGMDGLLGRRRTPPGPQLAPFTYDYYPSKASGVNFAVDGGDNDNLTSVFQGKLEDGIE